MSMTKNVLFMGANGFPAKVYAPVGALLGEALGLGGTNLNWRPFDYHGGLRHGTKTWKDMVDMTVKEVRVMVMVVGLCVFGKALRAVRL